MKLYLENHTSLKELVAEEKVFPFFRDHPLFVNNHDLPPTKYYRGPQRDPAFQPREILHAGHYVEPPPLNPALKHEAWQLAPEEIEADLALFYDIEDEPFYAPPPPAPVQPASAIFPYPHPHPPYYYDPLAAAPPGAPPYLAQAGYAPTVPVLGAPYGLPAYSVPPPAGTPLSTSAAVPPHPYATGGYSYDPPTSSAAAAPSTLASAPMREPVAPQPQRPPPPPPAALAPPVQPKASPTLHKTPVPASPVHVKAAPAVNGGSARSPPLPPMQMQRPPSYGSAATSTSNGHSLSHEQGQQQRSQQQQASAPAPRASQPQHHPYARQAESFQHSASPYGQPQSHSQPQQPRQHTQHSHPPTFPSPQPTSPSRPREQRLQPPSYPGAPQTAAQRFSPSFGVQTKAPSGMSASSKSPSLAHAGAPSYAHGPPPQQAPTSASLIPQRGTLFPSMPTPAPPTHPAHSPNGLAPPTLPSLSRKSTPTAGSPPRPRPPSAASSSSQQQQQQQQQQQSGQAPAPVVERVLAPFWASSSPVNGVGGASRGLPSHSQHQHQHQHHHQQHSHSHSQQVGPATGLPLPSWLKPLAQQVKLPHEVRREEEARAAKAAQAQVPGAAGGSAGAAGQGGTAGAQSRPTWAS